MKLQPVRGTRDIIAEEARLFREIENRFMEIAKIYDFSEIETPIFEFTSVFKRTLGDASDIVNKEMYTFEDRSGDSLTLRPEGTASVARAVISNSLLRDLPLKLFYSGPMFRHERPQKGRYRQFRQFGVELIGVENPLADIEVIAFAWDFFKSFNLLSKVVLEINTIGDVESRENYKKSLVDYFSRHKEKLSPESQERLTHNPLRILDSKDESDKEIILKAPPFSDHLNSESQMIFKNVLEGLSELGIQYHINPRLVRGLDYYSHTVFEFTTQHLGAQNAVLSGGRYNHLIEQMGGPSTPGVGWAAGTDRLSLLLEKPSPLGTSVAVLATDPGGEKEMLKTLQHLRALKIPSQPIYSGNISKQLKKADKRNCSHAVLIGSDEVVQKIYQLKDLKTGAQKSLSLETLLSELKGLAGV